MRLDKSLAELEAAAAKPTKQRSRFGMLPLYESVPSVDDEQTCSSCGRRIGPHAFAYPCRELRYASGWNFLCGPCGRQHMVQGHATRVLEEPRK